MTTIRSIARLLRKPKLGDGRRKTLGVERLESRIVLECDFGVGILGPPRVKAGGQVEFEVYVINSGPCESGTASVSVQSGGLYQQFNQSFSADAVFDDQLFRFLATVKQTEFESLGVEAILTSSVFDPNPSNDSDITFLELPVQQLEVGGTVFEDRDNNGVMDDQDGGVPDVQLDLYQIDSGIDSDRLIASTSTRPNGDYSFSFLGPGEYQVVIPESEFEENANLFEFTTSSGNDPAPDPDNDVDGDDNGRVVDGIGVSGGDVSLELGNEPTSEDSNPNTNLTVDFGFVESDTSLSLGGTVFRDENGIETHNGRIDSGEPGFFGVVVDLYRREEDRETIDPSNQETVDSTTTDNDGSYLFEGLDPGDYLVVIPDSQFQSDAVLMDHVTSSANDPPPDPDDNIDGDDNGRTVHGVGVSSGEITLAIGEEPTTEDSDPHSNLTVDFGFVYGVQVQQFSHHESIDRLAIDYVSEVPFQIGFFVSSDGSYTPGIGESAFYQIDVSDSAIAANPNLELVTQSDGTQTLLIDPSGTPLRTTLEDEDAEIILAVANHEKPAIVSTYYDELVVPFRGFYQSQSGARAVLRTGPDGNDEVWIRSSLEVSIDQNVSAMVSDPADVLVVTSAGDDFVFADSNIETPLVVKAGSGDDWVVGAMGDDEIDGGDGTDALLGEGFENGFGLAQIRSFLGDSLDRRISSASASIGLVGSGQDTIMGGDGFDFIVGGDGDDTILAGKGSAIIFGDGFGAGFGLDIDLQELFASDSESVLGKLSDALSIASSAGLQGSGGDTITGGDGFNLIVSGNGDDTVTGKGSVDLVFAGGGHDTVDGAQSEFVAAFGGTENDTLTGGSTSSVLVGGHNSDTLNGGPGIDLLIGDDYELATTDLGDLLNNLLNANFELQVKATPVGAGIDTLRGNGGFDVLIGGGGPDTLLAGEGGSLLGGVQIGDGLEIAAGPGISLKSLMTAAKDNQAKSKSLLQAGLGFIGVPTLNFVQGGDDTVEGSPGIDLILAGNGNDTVDTKGGFADVVLGGDGDDTIDASAASLGLLIGGAGNDSLVAGGFGSLLVGDDYTYSTPSLFSLLPSVDIDFDNGRFSKVSWQAGLTFHGIGDDTLISNSTFAVMVGGAGDDVIGGNAPLNLVVADEFNIGAGVTFDFVEVDEGKTDDERIALIDDRFDLPGLSGTGSDLINLSNATFNVILAGDGDDQIFGATDPLSTDLLFGNRGDDVIHGSGGFNIMIGGEQSDEITGGHEGNIVLGDTFDFAVGGLPDIEALKAGRVVAGQGLVGAGNGNDMISTGNGSDFIIGGDGSDTITAGDGMLDVIFGDSFNYDAGKSFGFLSTFGLTGITAWLLDANGFLDSLNPFALRGDGDDTIEAGDGMDVVIGGGGMDTIRGQGGTDFLVGAGGDDVVDGGDSSEIVFDDGNVVFGGPGDDKLLGAEGPDHLESEGGDDVFIGKGGNDVIFAGDGQDELYGESGNDLLFGERGDDLLIGGPGDDTFDGGFGSNTYRDLETEDIAFRNHNFQSPADVNDDGRVSAQDAVLVINWIVRNRESRPASETSKEVITITGYYDVSRDDRITALDVLRVINQIAREQSVSSAEPEFLSDSARTEKSDEIFAQFDVLEMAALF